MGEVTVITPSIPERARMLERARQSVSEQTHQPVAHLIGIDYAGVGPARIRNKLAMPVESEYLAFLDDDDTLEPQHLAVLHEVAERTGADVVYPDVMFDGPPLPKQHLPRPFSLKTLRSRGFFGITLLMRTATFQLAGGFPEDARYEDHQLWLTIAEGGGRFEYVPEKTWTYCTAHPDRRTLL